MDTEQEIIAILKEYNALCEGHFLLSSGRHSGQYIQCALVLKEPKIAKELCQALACKFQDDGIDVVVGPALGGIIVAYEVAGALGVAALFTERQNNEMTLRRGFSIREGDRVLVVEDVVTTGKSVKEVIKVIEQCKGVVVGVGSLIERGEEVDFGVSKKSLVSLQIENYEPLNCPLCRKNIPLVKPGSRKLA